MGIEIGITCLLLVALTLLATVDMAFSQLSDVGLRLLITESEEHPVSRSTPFLKEILENRPRFRFTISAAIQIMLVAVSVFITSISLRLFSSWEAFTQTRLVRYGRAIYRETYEVTTYRNGRIERKLVKSVRI